MIMALWILINVIENFNFHYENVVIKHSAEEKILGITIDNKLNFKSRITIICTIANQVPFTEFQII